MLTSLRLPARGMWLCCGYMAGDGQTDLAPASLPTYRPGENRVCLPARETAFKEIRARVAGTRLAAAQLGL